MTLFSPGCAMTEEEWIERFGMSAEDRATERLLQAVLDAMPNSIPDISRPCDREGCAGTYVLERTQDGSPDVFLGMDGCANAGLVCNASCGTHSVHYWCWDVEQEAER